MSGYTWPIFALFACIEVISSVAGVGALMWVGVGVLAGATVQSFVVMWMLSREKDESVLGRLVAENDEPEPQTPDPGQVQR